MPGERRLGGRDPALGGARRQAPVLGRAAAADGRDDRGRARRRSSPSARTCRSACSRAIATRSRATRRKRPPAAALAKELRAALAGGASVRRRSKVLFQHKRSPPRLLPAAVAGARRPPSAATMLPFYPAGWAPRARRRRGGSLRSARPARGPRARARGAVFPLGNVALGLALALRRGRARLARALLARCPLRARLPRRPAARAVGLLALVPLAVSRRAARPPRRAGARRRRRRGRRRRAARRRASVRAGRRAAARPRRAPRARVAAVAALVERGPARTRARRRSRSPRRRRAPVRPHALADRRPRRRRARGARRSPCRPRRRCRSSLAVWLTCAALGPVARTWRSSRALDSFAGGMSPRAA